MPPETVEKIKALALEGIRLSAITIQKILSEHGLGTKTRSLAGARDHARAGLTLRARRFATS